MTLDEAIKHCEEVAQENIKQAKHCSIFGDKQVGLECVECAKEHRQLAEWLRELKNYRIFRDVLFTKCDEWCKFPEYKEKQTMCGACEIGAIKDLLEISLDVDTLIPI